MATADHPGRGSTWSYVSEFLTHDRNPWDRGILDAHWYTGAPDSFLQRSMATARVKRRRPLALLLPWRRRYLDGLIWGMQKELDRRARLNSKP